MIKIKLFIILFISIIQFSFSQVEFYQSNNIPVTRNGIELINPWAGGMNFCQFSKIDLNLDGINDLFVFDKSGKNGTLNGNKKIPFLFNELTNTFSYAPEYINAFPDLTDWALLLDYNQDSKADIFTSYNSSIALYTNNSNTELSFEFTKIITSDAGFGPINLYVSSSDIPAIIDVDGDTDIDILSFDPTGSHMYFHENKSIQLYNNSDSIKLVRSDNCWGRFKEDFSTNSVTLNLDEDCNESDGEERFAHSGSTVLALDLDPSNNQGLELLLGDITYDNMIMLYNGNDNNPDIMAYQDLNFPSNNNPIDITRFPGSYYLDVDNDNLKDLIISPNGVNVSENHKNCLLYKNMGFNTNNTIEFEFIENDFLIKEMIDVGSNAVPILHDLNNDGLLDLIISNKGYFETGNYNSRIALYENIGTESEPAFEFVTDDFGGLSFLGDLMSVQAIHPTFGDLDNDQDIDMIIGDNNGQIYYFENSQDIMGGVSEFPVFTTYELLNIDIGSFSTPQLIDLNRDGLLDLIIGERMGIDNGIYNGINYFQNTGNINNPIFEDYTPEFESGDSIIKSLGSIHLADPIYLTGYTVPKVFEYNGVYHLAIGTESGLISLYGNIENNTNGNSNPTLNLDTEFDLITNNMLEINNCVRSSPAIHDLNNDGLPDLIRGNASGGVELFFSQNFNVFNEIYENGKINIFPNPNHGEFNIQIPNYLVGELKIYSSLGKLVYRKQLHSEYESIKLNHLNTGIFILQIESEKKLFIDKIIVN